jgi:hypothetical protein
MPKFRATLGNFDPKRMRTTNRIIQSSVPPGSPNARGSELVLNMKKTS